MVFIDETIYLNAICNNCNINYSWYKINGGLCIGRMPGSVCQCDCVALRIEG